MANTDDWRFVRTEGAILSAFLESYDLTGKTVVPFTTSGGSGLGKAPQRMQALSPGARVLAGGLLNGRPSRQVLRDWAGSLK